jgi:SAM-dependent methyltransferase
VTEIDSRALGEFYTPRWLAELILDESGYDGSPGKRFLDPSCGPGIFLVLAIERASRYAAVAGEDPRETVRRIVADIQGYELNPVSAQAARENYAAALGEPQPEIPVRCLDAILHPPEGERFDYVAGNPPWVRWDYLPKEYREATLPLWKRYGLFSLNGFQARLGHGKKDLSMLFTYAAADHYLKDGGTLAFVITQEVFKSKGAGEGFRRFRLGEEGPPLQVRSVHDFVKLRPFGGTSNKTAAMVLTKGAATTYPLPYYVWDRDSEGALHKGELQARPMVSACGPWRTSSDGSSRMEGSNPYKAMLGANANPYGVFWLEVEGPAQDGLAAVRNLPEMGKKQIPPVSARIEQELIFPAVRGADVRRWGARPGVHILVVQDPVTRRGYPEAILQQRWPRAFAYLEQFREELLRRALYRKYHQEAGHPFYSQFNIAPQTFAPFKVVWKRMAADLAATVVSEWDGPLGRKPLLPLETTAFIGTQDPLEAHYLCAIMNSEPVRSFVKSFSSAGRGFGTPYVASRIRIPPFDAADQRHRRLAELSQALHGGADLEGEKEIDAAVVSL